MSAEDVLQLQAQAIIDELACPGLDPECSIGMLKETVLSKLQSAQFFLKLAESAAQNNDLAQPDEPGAVKWCGWCGATAPEGGLEWDSPDEDVRLAGDPAEVLPAWFCAWFKACLQRRRARYPDRKTPELAAARETLALAQQRVAPVVLALAAWTTASQQAQQDMLALTAPRIGVQSRPGPLTGDAYRAHKWRHSLSSPANRRGLISGSSGGTPGRGRIP